MSSSQENPLKSHTQEEIEKNISDEQYEVLLNLAPNAFHVICDPDDFATQDCLKIVYDLVNASQFLLDQNQQFFDPLFADGIIQCLLSGQSNNIVELAIRILKNLWLIHPDFETPLLDPSIVLRLFDILEHTDVHFHYEAMKTILAYYRINPQTRNFLLQNDIYTKLRDFMITSEDPKHIKTGLKFLYNLIKNEFNHDWSEFLQFLPLFPKILNKSSLKNQHMALLNLSYLVEDDRIFQYCIQYQLHSTIAGCCANIGKTYAFHLYKCIFAFVRRNYLKAFSSKSIFLGMEYILKQNESTNISPLLFVISLLIDKYSQSLFNHKIYEPCIQIAKNGFFDNKLPACYCISKFIIYTPLSICDQLTREVGLETLCDLIECFGDQDIIIPLNAFKRLIEINRVLYRNLMIGYEIRDFLIMKYDEEMLLMKENPKEDVYKDITSLLFFLNNVLN